MRFYFAIALLFLALARVNAQECDTANGYRPVTIALTGDVLGEYTDTTTLDVKFFVYSNGQDNSLSENGTAGMCYPVGDENELKYCNDITVSLTTIASGSASYNYCIKRTSSGATALSRYFIQIDNIANRGWCLSLKPNEEGVSNSYYAVQCPEVPSKSFTTYFFIEPTVTAPVSSLRIMPTVTDKDSVYPVVYVDKYNSMEIRPALSLSFTRPSRDDSTEYGLFPLTFEPSSIFSFNYDKFIFDGTVHIEDEAIHTLTVSHTSPTTAVTESTYFNIRSVECEAGKYPVVFSRHYNDAQAGIYECYSISNSDNSVSYSSCPGGEWENTSTEQYGVNAAVHEHYACLDGGEYILTLRKYNNNEVLFDAWAINSFLSIIALSHKEENVNFIGYIIGDFSYSATYDVDHNRENTNVAKINVGPIVCNEGERVVIFQKYSTVLGGSEGFEVKGSQSTTTLSFFGSANLDQRRFDPLYKMFICLTGDDYTVKLISKASINPVDHTSSLSCGSWSTVKSVESVEYTPLTGDKVNAIHPSFLRIEILNTNSYSGGNVENAETIIEGENIAVFGADRAHIANPYCASHPIIPVTDIYDEVTGRVHYDCHYDLAITVISPAAYDVKDNDVVVGINSINKYINDPADIKIQCQDQSNGDCTYIQDYTITCHATTADAINNVNPVPCSSYGLTFVNSGINAGASGNFATPNSLPDEFHVRIVSNIKQNYSLTKSSLTSYVHYNLNEVIDQCSLFFIKQGESVEYQGISVDAENVVCTLNGQELSAEQVIVTKNPSSMKLDFTISSNDIITCSIADKVISVYSEPSCKNIDAKYTNLPLYQSLALNAEAFTEECTEEGRTSEVVCVYDPLTLKASIQTHETACHILSSENVVPAGHGYVKATFSVIADSYPDVNAAPLPSWFKRFIEDAFENASRVPLRNAYVTGIRYTSNAEVPNVELDMVFDTAYEYTTDFVNYLTENTNTVDAVNLKLEQSIPGYFTTHKLSLVFTDYESTPNKCLEVTDTEGFDYEFFDEATHTSVVHTYEGAVWKETIIWYYAFNAVPLPDNNVDAETPYDTENNRFWGAFTRYCKPKYYEAYFLGVNALSAAQTNVENLNSLFLTVIISNLDPRSVGTETRYLVARALDRYVINYSSNGAENYAELFDINVHMIEGRTPVDTDSLYYKDTAFYVQIRVRSNVQEQFDIVKTSLQTVITNAESCTVQGEVASSMLSFMGKHFGVEWGANQKDISICFYPDWNTANVINRRTLRY